MKLFGTELKPAINLLPLDSFQRHLLSGISGVLVWLVVSVWPFHLGSGWRFGWNWSEPAPLLNGLADHLSESLWDMRYAIYVDAFSFISEVARAIIGVVPSIAGIAVLASSVVMVLGAFKIVTYPSRIQRFAPGVLGVTLALILLIQIVARPAYSAFGGSIFGFSIGSWIEDLLTLSFELAIPTTILAISMVPVFAPIKEHSKATKSSR
jgi:hypothetical protein